MGIQCDSTHVSTDVQVSEVSELQEGQTVVDKVQHLDSSNKPSGETAQQDEDLDHESLKDNEKETLAEIVELPEELSTNEAPKEAETVDRTKADETGINNVPKLDDKQSDLSLCSLYIRSL